LFAKGGNGPVKIHLVLRPRARLRSPLVGSPRGQLPSPLPG
jgi:hypothetical protein